MAACVNPSGSLVAMRGKASSESAHLGGRSACERGSASTIRLGAALLCAASFVLPVSAAQGSRTEVGSARFAVTRQASWTVGVPGTALGIGDPSGTSRNYTTKTFLNRGGGGQFTTRVAGTSPSQCNVASIVLQAMRANVAPLCTFIADQELPLIDLSLIRRKYLRPVNAPFPFSATGEKLDDVTGDDDAILEGREELIGNLREGEPDAEPSSLLLDATAEMLANPNAALSTRRLLISDLAGRPDFVFATDVSDPIGRPASSVTLVEPSHLDRFRLATQTQSIDYDLTQTRLAHTIYYDPHDFRILATQTKLLATDVPEVSDWLEQRGGTAPIFTSTYSPVRKVRRPELRQTSVPCKQVNPDLPPNPERTCIDFGRPGGKYLVTGG